MFSFHTVIAR